MTTSLARTEAQRPVTVVDPTAPKALERVALTMPAQQLRTLIQERTEMDALIAQYLKEGVDYGLAFPKRKGKRDEDEDRPDRKTLLKPGAEKVCNAYNVYPRYELIEREADHLITFDWRKTYKNGGVAQGTSQGLYRYVVRCLLIHRPSGIIIGEGLGSASTMESKYIRAPREAENTVLKIAKKRSHVDASLTAFNLSDRFTQDVEDLHDEEEEETSITPAQQPAAPTYLGFPYPNEHQGKPLDTKKEDGKTYLFSADTIQGTITFAQKKLASKDAKNPDWLKRYIAEAESELQRRAFEAEDALEEEPKQPEPATPEGSPSEEYHKAGIGMAAAMQAAAEHATTRAAPIEDPYLEPPAQAGTGSRRPRAPAPTSLFALTEKLTGLMKHAAFDDTARARVRHDLVEGMEADEIQAHITAAEQTIATYARQPHPGGTGQ